MDTKSSKFFEYQNLRANMSDIYQKFYKAHETC